MVAPQRSALNAQVSLASDRHSSFDQIHYIKKFDSKLVRITRTYSIILNYKGDWPRIHA